MAATTLDSITALIVVDLQKGLLALPAVHPIENIVNQAGVLARAFREHDLPVVLVNVAGGAPGRTETPRPAAQSPADWTDLAPGLDHQPGDHLVTKRTWGAFTGTNLQAYLKGRGVTQVVVAGVATSIGVESTARQAYELGYNVTVATDAVTDMSAEAHANSIERIFPRLGETGTVRRIIDLLARERA